MYRIFISHSSTDNHAAVAFQNWANEEGWHKDGVFLDLDDIDAGKNWKEVLLSANDQCEVVIRNCQRNSPLR